MKNQNNGIATFDNAVAAVFDEDGNKTPFTKSSLRSAFIGYYDSENSQIYEHGGNWGFDANFPYHVWKTDGTKTMLNSRVGNSADHQALVFNMQEYRGSIYVCGQPIGADGQNIWKLNKTTLPQRHTLFAQTRQVQMDGLGG